MISVTLTRRNGVIVKVRAEGHSGLGSHGNDVLCAAASAIVQTAYLAIVDIGGDTEYIRDGERGLFEFTVGDSHRRDCDVILRAMLVGIKDLTSGYPQNIKLEELSCL